MARSSPIRNGYLALLLAAAVPAWPQSAPTGRPLRTDATEIVIPFVAVDSRDRLLSTLRAGDVRLYDDGHERAVTSLLLEDGPASILFVVDVSRSMRNAMPEVSAALERMVDTAVAGDEFAVLEFSDNPGVTVAFTTDENTIRTRLRGLSASGRTSLVDAAVDALRTIQAGRHDRKAIVLVTDGHDNHSRYTQRDALRLARETDARIYGIELYPPLGEAYTPATLLESLSETTGGRYLPTMAANELPDLISRIDAHHFYRATFRLPAAAIDGKPHRIHLKLSRADVLRGGKLFWKRGYQAVKEIE